MEPFPSSDSYDDEAHQLYNEGRFDEAVTLLNEGLLRYPESVELLIAMGYARLAREEFAWARRAFHSALTLDGDHEDALAGIGETSLVLGQVEAAFMAFQRLIELGFDDDHELMMQAGRALFREGYFAEARRFFEEARDHYPSSSEAAASLGYCAHRLGLDADALYWLRRSLEIDPFFAEPRIYLANILYDRNEMSAALLHFARTDPEDHLDDLGLWRAVELLRTTRGLDDHHPELSPWLRRLVDLSQEELDEDQVLTEIEARQSDGSIRDPSQLELFGTLMRDLPAMQRRPQMDAGLHLIETLAGLTLRGTWDELLLQLQVTDGAWADGTTNEFMATFARRGLAETGVTIPVTTAEAFIRGAAEAGIVRVLQ